MALIRGNKLTYVLNPLISKIESGVICIDGDKKWEFSTGKEACQYRFNKYYRIEGICARNSIIEITLVENNQINWTDCAGEEQISFF